MNNWPLTTGEPAIFMDPPMTPVTNIMLSVAVFYKMSNMYKFEQSACCVAVRTCSSGQQITWHELPTATHKNTTLHHDVLFFFLSFIHCTEDGFGHRFGEEMASSA